MATTVSDVRNKATGLIGGATLDASTSGTDRSGDPRVHSALTRALTGAETGPSDFRWVVTVHCDSVMGRDLFIRGSGGGLSWDKGIPMKRTGVDTWALEVCAAEDGIEYKIVCKDHVWEKGPNHVLSRGKTAVVAPTFKSAEIAQLSLEPEARLQVRCAVPEGCELYIRGNKGGLSWDSGLKLTKTGVDTWELSDLWRMEEGMEFKILCNDRVWEEGPNHVLSTGSDLSIAPAFKKEDLTALAPKKPVTRLEVVCEIPSEWKLYIRGGGSGLSWDRGIAMKRTGDNTWELPEGLEITEDTEYKLLIEDEIWEGGKNHILHRGREESLTPAFGVSLSPSPRGDRSPIEELEVVAPTREVTLRDLPMSSSQGEDISYIVSALGNDGKIALIAKGMGMLAAGERIKSVHPLKFLEYIFNNDLLSGYVGKIKENKFRWGQFIKGFSEKMDLECSRHNLVPYLRSFCESTGKDYKSVLTLVTLKQWEQLVMFLAGIS